VLRDWRDSDAEPLAAPFADDPALGALIGFDDDPTPASLREFWATRGEERENDGFLGLVVAERGSEAPLGITNLYDLRRNHRRCELGIWLIPEGRGRGAACEAMRLLCRWAFDTLELERIALRTLPANAPMMRLAERAGFTHEGDLRHFTFERGRFLDNAVCSVLREEFTWPG
jgi:RimJ/RimL family protein N-acetyltransferase